MDRNNLTATICPTGLGEHMLFYLLKDVSQAAAIIAFTTISTGTMSATLFLSIQKDLTVPKLAPNGILVGPFALSIHPGIGSFHVLSTMQQKNMSL
jgi:hypothetical protein